MAFVGAVADAEEPAHLLFTVEEVEVDRLVEVFLWTEGMSVIVFWLDVSDDSYHGKGLLRKMSGRLAAGSWSRRCPEFYAIAPRRVAAADAMSGDVVRLAKNHIDVGMMTGQIDAQLEFWQNDVGLPFEELLLLGGGRRQHRHGLNGSVLKINESRGPLPEAPPAGYRELLIARDGIPASRRMTPGLACALQSGMPPHLTTSTAASSTLNACGNTPFVGAIPSLCSNRTRRPLLLPRA